MNGGGLFGFRGGARSGRGCQPSVLWVQVDIGLCLPAAIILLLFKATFCFLDILYHNIYIVLHWLVIKSHL